MKFGWRVEPVAGRRTAIRRYLESRVSNPTALKFINGRCCTCNSDGAMYSTWHSDGAVELRRRSEFRWRYMESRWRYIWNSDGAIYSDDAMEFRWRYGYIRWCYIWNSEWRYGIPMVLYMALKFRWRYGIPMALLYFETQTSLGIPTVLRNSDCAVELCIHDADVVF